MKFYFIIAERTVTKSYSTFLTNLFTAVRRQVERQHRQKGDAHAWYDEVDCVEQRLPPYRDIKRDVKVRLVAARVELLMPETYTACCEVKGCFGEN